jgi:hypothetical protein
MYQKEGGGGELMGEGGELERNHIHIQNKHNQNPGREHDREYDTSLVPKKKKGVQYIVSSKKKKGSRYIVSSKKKKGVRYIVSSKKKGGGSTIGR